MLTDVIKNALESAIKFDARDIGRDKSISVGVISTCPMKNEEFIEIVEVLSRVESKLSLCIDKNQRYIKMDCGDIVYADSLSTNLSGTRYDALCLDIKMLELMSSGALSSESETKLLQLISLASKGVQLYGRGGDS